MTMRGTRRRWALAAVLVFGLAALWMIGLWRFADSLPTQVADPTMRTDAIVVLTGGSLRIKTGLKLLADGMAKKLFISGVYQGVDVAQLLHASRQAPSRVLCCIALGHSADNTEGNARETAAWMAAQGYRSLRLVTASYHMPRSLLDFSRAMPKIKIIPNPVFPAFMKTQPWWRSPAALGMILSEYDKYLVALLRPLLPAVLLPREWAG